MAANRKTMGELGLGSLERILKRSDFYFIDTISTEPTNASPASVRSLGD
jgi:hypothetical protein